MDKHKKLLLSLGFVALSLILFLLAHRIFIHGTRSHKLIAHWIFEKADTGIPGVTKWYEATLTNFGALPGLVARCNYVDDAGSAGTEVAYTVERWNDDSGKWEPVFLPSAKNFCKPYPLGIVKGEFSNKRLWPGQSLSTGEEITAARKGIRKGDFARFIIFTGTPGDYTSSVATSPFLIDEEPTDRDIQFRVKH